MIKKIKVHTVTNDEVTKQFATKKQASDAIEILKHFGVEAHQKAETVEVKI